MADNMRNSIGENHSMGGNENLLFISRNGKTAENTGLKSMGGTAKNSSRNEWEKNCQV